MGKRSKRNKVIDEDTANINSGKVLNKKIKYEESIKSDTVEPVATPSEKTKIKKQKNKSLKTAKISEDDGGSIETHSDLSEEKSNNNTENLDKDPPNDANGKKKNKRKDVSQNDEEEVKDIDIDQFCDELTEEDNVQYDNWVKLIEAKLHSNTKKPK